MTFTTTFEFLAMFALLDIILIGWGQLLEDILDILYLRRPRLLARVKRMYLRGRYPPFQPKAVCHAVKNEIISVVSATPDKDFPENGRVVNLTTHSLNIEYSCLGYDGECSESVEISLVACPKAGILEIRFSDGKFLGVQCSNWEPWQFRRPDSMDDSQKFCFYEIGRIIREAAAGV